VNVTTAAILIADILPFSSSGQAIAVSSLDISATDPLRLFMPNVPADNDFTFAWRVTASSPAPPSLPDLTDPKILLKPPNSPLLESCSWISGWRIPVHIFHLSVTAENKTSGSAILPVNVLSGN